MLREEVSLIPCVFKWSGMDISKYSLVVLLVE